LIIKQKFNYQPLKRIETAGQRLYSTSTGNLPSVTTILSATKSEESKLALDAWRNRIGHERASQTVTEASNVGTLIHSIMEHWFKGDTGYDPGNNLIHRQAKSMAEVIKKSISSDLSEIWGNEISLYYPDLYAGTADLVGVWKGKESICDFKQTNKPKKSEWIDDYRLQLTAYALAHNALYGTDIKQGAIFMCSRDGTFQLFEVTEEDFPHWSAKWAERVAAYYEKTGK
jgi:ATP-dependent exoDNAse (exonuclease V) beta subunit